MKNIMRHLLTLCIVSVLCHPVIADDGPKKPHQIVSDLQKRMYAIGETTGRYNDFIAAEHKAAEDIRAYIAKVEQGIDPGINSALVEKNKNGQTPLTMAAFMGYAELTGELLKSVKVRQSINDVDSKGMSAWHYANFAFRQSLWACNPTVFQNPFSWVPLFVTQPYYLQSPENPYRNTRRLLEEAGAKTDLTQAKLFWQDTCKLQAEDTRTKVQETNDLLETVLTAGSETLSRFIAEVQRKR